MTEVEHQEVAVSPLEEIEHLEWKEWKWDHLLEVLLVLLLEDLLQVANHHGADHPVDPQMSQLGPEQQLNHLQEQMNLPLGDPPKGARKLQVEDGEVRNKNQNKHGQWQKAMPPLQETDRLALVSRNFLRNIF